MISYIILHYRRPYFLELNVKIIRKYAPPNTQIIVIDDGSGKDVIKKISKFPIDDIVVGSKNENYHYKGTCSKVFNKAKKICKNKYTIFSEDDFFYSPLPVTIMVKGGDEGKNLMSYLRFIEQPKFSIFYEALDLLKNNKKIKQVQLARDTVFDKRWKTSKTTYTTNVKWKVLINRDKKYYHCNWPYIMRTDELHTIKIPDGLSINGIEIEMDKITRKVFGKNNWAVAPKPPHYVHVGRGLSQSYLFNFRRTKYVKELIKKSGLYRHIEPKNYANFLCDQYVLGNFVVDFDLMIEKGLDESFKCAFNLLQDNI